MNAPRALRALAQIFLALLILAGCTTLSSTGLGIIGASPEQGPSVPASETLGQGDIVVGVLIGRGQRGLSGGAANSVHLAARLAASNPAAALVKFEVRTVGSDVPAIRRAADALRQAGAQLIIADLDVPGSLAAAGSSVPMISLARDNAVSSQLYWAGFNDLEEAAAIVRAAQSRGVRSLAVVLTADTASQNLAASMVTVGPQLGIGITTLSAQTTRSVLDYLVATEADDRADAIMFATPAHVARALAQPVTEALGAMPVQVIGNASWATGQGDLSGLAPGWYPSLPTAGLARFSERFRDAFNALPSVRSAMAYDLMILAAALPTLVEQDPFERAVLTNAQGFTGFTGAFRFQSSGIVAQRQYEIVELR